MHMFINYWYVPIPQHEDICLRFNNNRTKTKLESDASYVVQVVCSISTNVLLPLVYSKQVPVVKLVSLNPKYRTI